MSSKRRNGRKRVYTPPVQQFATVGPDASSAEGGWSKLLDSFRRFLPHTQEDDVAKLRWIVIFVVMLVVIEFTVIALVFSANPPVLQNKNAGQATPVDSKGTSSGSACNPNNVGGSNLQNTPTVQGQNGGVGTQGALQATPQSSKCL
ncbi:MAG TPA: hypothetical protein VNX65_00280 [Patescibacteria group bacterium]|jgi:hypothetical protein|nr:hypothetical protein [Patescibacteria group bacterium]